MMAFSTKLLITEGENRFACLYFANIWLQNIEFNSKINRITNKYKYSLVSGETWQNVATLIYRQIRHKQFRSLQSGHFGTAYIEQSTELCMTVFSKILSSEYLMIFLANINFV